MLNKEDAVALSAKGNVPRQCHHEQRNGQVSGKEEPQEQAKDIEEVPRPHGTLRRGVCHYCKKYGHKWRYCRACPPNWMPPFLRKGYEEENGEDDPSPPEYAL